MKRYKIALIRVLTTGIDEVMYFQQKNLTNAFPQFEITTYEIEDQPEGIHDDASMKKAVPKIVQLGKTIAKEYDGIIVNCAGDPGVALLSKEVNIPVVGAGTPAALLAMAKSDKIGVLGIHHGEAPENYQQILGNSIIGYACPEGIVTAMDLQTPQGKKAIRAAAEQLVKAGADTIVYACTGYTITGAWEQLHDLPVRLIDPSYAQAAQMLVECIGRYSI